MLVVISKEDMQITLPHPCCTGLQKLTEESGRTQNRGLWRAVLPDIQIDDTPNRSRTSKKLCIFGLARKWRFPNSERKVAVYHRPQELADGPGCAESIGPSRPPSAHS